jgi:hypothetical protein
MLRDLIASFPAGSTAGPTGLRPLHLAETLRDGAAGTSSELLIQIDRLVTKCGSGDLDPVSARYLWPPPLLPLRKKDGGIRPVAVGETFRRVTEKALIKMPATQAVMASLAPTQTAFGGKNACELVAMTFQHLILQAAGDSQWVLLQVDIKNAFNTVQRSAIHKALLRRAPHLLPWASVCLQPTPLYVDDSIIESTEGGQQGAPLVPLLFALAIHDVVRSVPACPANFWYLDDGTIGGSLEQAEAALRHLVPSLADLGCQVNWSKTTVWGPGLPDTATQAGLPETGFEFLRQATVVPFQAGSGVKVLGIPVHPSFDSSFVRDCLESAVDKQENACKTLSALRDPQIQHHLLRACYDS